MVAWKLLADNVKANIANITLIDSPTFLIGLPYLLLK